MALGSRLKHAWNAFLNKDPTEKGEQGFYYRPDRIRLTRGNERSIINSIYNHLAVDCASVDIMHVRLDENKRFIEAMNSGLNNCLQVEANIDQTSRSFIQDIVMSLLDEGVVAIVPVDTTIDPTISDSFDIKTLRTAKIVQWMPTQVKVNLYNDRTGLKEDVILPKKSVSIVENPFYSIMNEPNSTLQRLIRKLTLLDGIDEKIGADRLDLIIQLPYTVKTELKKQQSENRRKEIENQLSGAKHGIAYIDATEKVTQLNRPLDNQLLSQIESLTNQLFSQLGLTMEILNGTADDSVMNNYFSRTIEPILSAICDEMKRKFLTKTARTQNQSVEFFRDPFKLVAVTQLPDIVDKFTRNEVLTSNEVRQIIGLKPSEDPSADELRNKNISASPDQEHVDINGDPIDVGIPTKENFRKEIQNER